MFSRLVIAAGTAVVAILRAVGRALYEPDDGERVSTWSIRKRDARTFYLLLAALWMGAAAALAWGQYDEAPPRVVEWALLSPHAGDGSVYVVAQRFGALVIPLMAAALLADAGGDRRREVSDDDCPIYQRENPGSVHRG